MPPARPADRLFHAARAVGYDLTPFGLGTPFHEYSDIFREDRSLTVAALIGAARQQAFCNT
jgi:hypothetical protein